MSFQRHDVALAELIIVGALGATGFIISRPWFVVGWNALDPMLALFLWYMLLTVWLYIVFTLIQYAGRARIKISAGKVGAISGVGLTETIALILFLFAFFIVWNFFESGYTTDILGVPPVPNTFLGTEDSVFYILYHQWLGFSVQTAGVLTYVVTPMVLALIAASLVCTKMYIRFLQMAGH